MARHRATRIDCDRLGSVMDALRRAGERGLSIREMVSICDVTDPKDAVYELRHLGVEILSVWHKSKTGKKFVRYVLRSNSGGKEAA